MFFAIKFAVMKKIKSIIIRRRYRRLFHKLFWIYLNNPETYAYATHFAGETFLELTGVDYWQRVGRW